MKNCFMCGLCVVAFLLAVSGSVAARDARHARAVPFQGSWGVRILLPTAYDIKAEVNAENFDINAFMAQIDQLTTINHVMINIGRGHQASWYSSPYPEMEAIMGDDLFPERDFFGEMVDALRARNLKVLVYFSGTGMDQGYLSKAQMAIWRAHLKSSELTHAEGVARILEYYAVKYGNKIDGWWVDRCGRMSEADRDLYAKAIRAGNENAMIAMHMKVGYPIRQGTPHCDYTAGHPVPMIRQPPWTQANVAMVENIEAGPWINQSGEPDDREGSALGAIFMPFQSQWRNGKAGFSIDLAVEWTTRVMDAGGMYTWAVARVGNGFASRQFQQLVQINAAIEERRETQSLKAMASVVCRGGALCPPDGFFVIHFL